MTEKVLIVDDSKFARSTNKKLLMNLGYEVFIEAVDGVNGIAKCKESNPDLIITDIEMPNIDGIEMIKQIREFNQEVFL